MRQQVWRKFSFRQFMWLKFATKGADTSGADRALAGFDEKNGSDR
jgi:hypothetical protein